METRELSRSQDSEGIVPITGFSCWALGYIDGNCKLVGCLLHPAQNEGVDLRHRVAYGEKCQREICPDAKVFSELALNEKKFWLHLVDGLDSFSYSSKRMNPFFNLMGWGSHLLSLVASKERHRIFSKKSFFEFYPFFSIALSPRANAYLINQLINKENMHILESHFFLSEFEIFSAHISNRLNQMIPSIWESPHVRLLNLGREFSDLLRLSAHILRIERDHAVRLKQVVDEEIAKLRQSQLFLTWP
jgi:hypothetical protein